MSRSRCALLGLLAFALSTGATSGPVAADDPVIDDSPDDAPAPPPPRHWDAKRPLSPGDLKRKKQEGYVTGLPLANFDSNTGFGAGVRGYYYYNGERDDPLFAYTPYLHRLFLQFFATSKGLQFHWLDYDAPALAGSAYRIRAALIYLRNTEQHFYGIGEEALGELTFTGAGRSYDSFEDYNNDLERVRPDGTTLARYDHYDIQRPIFIAGVERTFLRGLIRPLIGLGFTYSQVDDYSGREVDAVDASGNTVRATMGMTRLEEQCMAGLVVGCDEGWDNFLRLGISLDTRDFEPDPNSGWFADMAVDLGSTALGSGYNYARFLTSARYYYSPFPRLTDLVVATRGTFMMQSDGVPYFSMSVLPYTEDAKTGLGGLRTLRGFQQDRFVGRVVALLNLELRWTYYRFMLLKQKFALMGTAFVDTGRTFDRVADFTLRGFRRGQGAAFRIAWNQATIVTFEYGFSDEDTGVYVNFNHQF